MNRLLMLCLFLYMLLCFQACTYRSSSAEETARPSAGIPAAVAEEIPEDVINLFENYMFSNRLGLEVAVEGWFCDAYFLQEAILDPDDYLLDYRLERIEAVNDCLYAVSFWAKSKKDVLHDDVYHLVHNFIAYIDDNWRYLNGVAHIPDDLKENLDETQYTSEPSGVVLPEAVNRYEAEPEGIPKEVTQLLEDFMCAYMLGTEYSIAYMHFEDEFMQQAYLSSHSHLLDYRVESIEQINENLFVFTLWMRSLNSALYHRDAFQKIYNFACRIDGEWFYLNGLQHIPQDQRENLDESRYTYDDSSIVPYEDVIGSIG